MVDIGNSEAYGRRDSSVAGARRVPHVFGRQVEIPKSWVTDPGILDLMGAVSLGPDPDESDGMNLGLNMSPLEGFKTSLRRRCSTFSRCR